MTRTCYRNPWQKCRKDEDVWCQEQLNNFRTEAPKEEVTTQPPATTTEEQKTTAAPAATTEALEQTTATVQADGDQGAGNGGRWGPLLRIMFPQFFNRQAGAAAVAPRNVLAPNAGPGRLPLAPGANAGLLGGGANVLPVLGRNIAQANNQRIPLLGANQRTNAGQIFRGSSFGAPALPRRNVGQVSSGNIAQANNEQIPLPGANQRTNAGPVFHGTGSNFGAPALPRRNGGQVSSGKTAYPTRFGQSARTRTTGVGQLARGGSRSILVGGDDRLTLTLNHSSNGPLTDSATIQGQNLNWNNVASSSRDEHTGLVQHNRNPGYATYSGNTATDNAITLISGSTLSNTIHNVNGQGVSNVQRGSE